MLDTNRLAAANAETHLVRQTKYEQQVNERVKNSLKDAHDHTLGIVSTHAQAHEKELQTRLGEHAARYESFEQRMQRQWQETQSQWQEAQRKANTEASQQAAVVQRKVTAGVQQTLKNAHTLGVVSTQVEAHEKQMQ